MDVRLAAGVAGAVGNVSAFCREQGVSRQTFYKWRARFAAEGLAGLGERSRRPRSSPRMIAGAVEDEVVRWRKELSAQGLDAGADSIRWQLERAGISPLPSRSTVFRVLARRGLVTPAPSRRPRAALRRFVYARPNECWQADATGWQLAGGSPVEIVSVLDDCTRYAAAGVVVAGTATTVTAWTAFQAAATAIGLPARVLTDNGLIFSGYRRGVEVAFETGLRALGVQPITSTPRHPQTCGKVERYQQTLKRWLDAQPPAQTLTALQSQLDTFRDYYNTRRPHRALHGATPAEHLATLPHAGPATEPVGAPQLIRHVTTDNRGIAECAGYRIALGAQWRAQPVTVWRHGTHAAVFSAHQLIRALELDPTRRYQALPSQ